MSANDKNLRRQRRKKSIRRKVFGTAERPRLTVSRSLKHIYAQAIDDTVGRTVASASSLNDESVSSLLGDAGEQSKNVAVGQAVGKAIARKLKEQRIEQVVFDRNGYLYHGRVKAVADGARDEGLQF